MPGKDGTGPLGMGPMSGRAAGYCAGFGVPGYANMGRGRGWRAGFGRGGGAWGGGRGWRHQLYATGLPGWARGTVPYPAPAVPEQELAALKQQAEHLGGMLEQIRARIQELEAKPASA